MDSTILIADDEQRMRKLVKDFLKQKNYNIREKMKLQFEFIFS